MAGVERPALALVVGPRAGWGPPAQPPGVQVGSNLASPQPPGPGAGLHLSTGATLSSSGCHLSSGSVSLGQFSPIPQPHFGGYLFGGTGLEGQQVDAERSPKERKEHCSEPPTAGECGAFPVCMQV